MLNNLSLEDMRNLSLISRENNQINLAIQNKTETILKGSGLTDLTVDVYRFHNTPELTEKNIKEIDDKIYHRLTEWIFNFDCIYKFDEPITDKIIILINQLDKVVAYACLNFYEEGVIDDVFDNHFPTIKLSMEQYKFRDKNFTEELFEYIYQYFHYEFLLQTDYPETGYIWRTKIKCLPIVDFFTEEIGYYVYPTPRIYSNIFTHDFGQIEEHNDEVECWCDDCFCEKKEPIMSNITTTMYPGYCEQELIKWGS